jgi:hypothetical protein
MCNEVGDKVSESVETLVELVKGVHNVGGGVNAADGGGCRQRGVSTKYLSNQIQQDLLEGVCFQGQLHVQAGAVTVN